jgi:hypothetical protein
MIFPNRAPDPQLRPGMGYQGGSHALLGYEPGADALGYVAGRMGYQGGAHALGAVSDAELQVAYDAGLDGNTLDALSAAGATDADIQALIAGNTDVPTLMAKYAGLKTTEGTTVTQTGGSIPAPTSTAQVPPGSTLLYTCTVNTPPLHSAQDIINAISPLLPGHGMAMVTSQVSQQGSVSGPASFSLTVMDSVGNALKSDAQSVLDGLVENSLGAGNLQLQSSLSVVSPGTTASGTAAAANNPLMFLENNALYIGLAVAGIVLLNNLTGGKKR